MLKKILLAVATLIATMHFAFAQVDVNKADQAALDGVKGLGPKTSKIIIDERKKNGEFKDWADFQTRVKGIGDKSSEKLSEAGLTVNGQPKSKATAAAKTDKTDKKADAKAMTSSAPAASSTAAAPAAKPADPKEAKPAAKKDEPKK